MPSQLQPTPDTRAKSRLKPRDSYCSFCGKSQHEVKKLIAGPAAFICNECVALCVEIIGEPNKLARGARRLWASLRRAR